MSAAIFGFLGVIAGGILTGVVQALIARGERKRVARVAARLLYYELLRTRDAADRELKDLAWNPAATPAWEGAPEAWGTYRTDLAAGISGRDFLDLAGAFSTLASFYEVREADLAAGSGQFMPPAHLASEALAVLDKATRIVGQTARRRQRKVR